MTKRHGNAGTRRRGQTPEYRSWIGMKERCESATNKDYKYYGGRGICVCERWRDSFEAFLADMGPRPSPKHSIDRYPDNDGDYAPGNCRWATREAQSRNSRRCRLDPLKVRAAHALVTAGFSRREIAAILEVGYMTIARVLTGQSWRGVELSTRSGRGS